ncbi:hypothetical protein M2281_002300 [Mesorhizobium soli]|nr:hypothetical protein [Mesorhizobium soli]
MQVAEVPSPEPVRGWADGGGAAAIGRLAYLSSSAMPFSVFFSASSSDC